MNSVFFSLILVFFELQKILQFTEYDDHGKFTKLAEIAELGKFA